jgi:hypothetical protein
MRPRQVVGTVDQHVGQPEARARPANDRSMQPAKLLLVTILHLSKLLSSLVTLGGGPEFGRPERKETSTRYVRPAQTYFAGNLDALVGYPPTQAPSGCGSGDARTFVGSNLSTKLYILSAANLTCQQAYSLLLAVGSSSVIQVDGGCSEGLATIVAGANLNGACRTVPDVLAVYLA